jgi:hypothetical protein
MGEGNRNYYISMKPALFEQSERGRGPFPQRISGMAPTFYNGADFRYSVSKVGRLAAKYIGKDAPIHFMNQ